MASVASLARIMNRAHQAMDNHGEKFVSGPGQFAGITVSGTAALVVLGAANQEDLNNSVRYSAELSGIPMDAMSAFADFAFAMHSGAISIENASPFGGGSNE
ncbi:MAG: hypothetical protein HOI45_04380 [Rhodospirillaceae bacterium]|jgi:hypothetical protein|nr:hypothetical protein [Rhodospirillaceae bacterium]